MSGIVLITTDDERDGVKAPASDRAQRQAFDDWSPALQKSRAYEQILLDIILGELAAGSRLDEQALVRRYDAGLAGVRDALGRLALEGLVARRARSGTTVTTLDIVELRQAFEARALLEPHCAALAATHATRDDHEALITAFDGAEQAVRLNDRRALVVMDQRFHLAMTLASRNATLARIILPLQHKVARYWVYSMDDDTEEGRLAEIRRHQTVTDRIVAGDAEGARQAMAAMSGGFIDIMTQAKPTPVPKSSVLAEIDGLSPSSKGAR